MRSLLLVITGVVAVVAALCFAAGYTTHRPPIVPATSSPGPPIAATAVAREGTIDETLTLSGRVGPPAGSDAKLAFAIAGVVGSIDVSVGERVTAGEPLAHLRSQTLADAAAAADADAAAATSNYGDGRVPRTAAASAEQKLAVAEARLGEFERGGIGALSDRIGAVALARQAAIKVVTDQASLDRSRTLYAGGVVARKDVQAAQSQLELDVADRRAAEARVAAARLTYASTLRTARADVAQATSDLTATRAQGGVLAAQADGARARADLAAHDLDQAVLRASHDGVVVAVLKHAGESVDPTTPAIDVGPLVGREATLSVSSLDARRIRVGDDATLGLQNRGSAARAVVVAVVPAVDPTTQTSTVVLSGVPPGALGGDAVTARIVVAHVRGVVVPTAAVLEDPGSGKSVVYVATGKANEPFTARDVTLAGSNEHDAVIATGLRAGERIATQGSYDLLAPSE